MLYKQLEFDSLQTIADLYLIETWTAWSEDCHLILEQKLVKSSEKTFIITSGSIPSEFSMATEKRQKEKAKQTKLGLYLNKKNCIIFTCSNPNDNSANKWFIAAFLFKSISPRKMIWYHWIIQLSLYCVNICFGGVQESGCGCMCSCSSLFL